MSAHHSDRYPFGPRTPPPASESRQFSLPQYKVILLQDAVNDLPFIVRAVMELTRLCKDEATLKMWEAHHRGRSVLLRTYQERAELFVVLFAEKGLNVAMEPE